MTWLTVLLCVLALPAFGACAYLALLAIMSLRARPLAPAPPRLRFTFLVPAHNEEHVLARTIQSLLGVTWPREQFRVHVVADNCVDATAQIARREGAQVTERQDQEKRGKGYALAAGLVDCLQDGFADAVVVVDADSTVDQGFLAAMQAHLDQGASVVQARYGVLNATEGWRARLMTLALALFHDVRSCGRQVLGLSCGLRGNGMCFTRDVLARFPLQAASLVEDVEQGIILGRGGVRVHHAMETRVLGEMPTGGKAAGPQRLRWEQGRVQMRQQWLRPLLSEAWSKRSGVLLDLALDLWLPPLTNLTLAVGLGWAASLTLALVGGGAWALWCWSGALGLLMVYVATGVHLSERGWRAWLDLAAAPVFVAWKLGLALQNRRRAPGTWVRTTREGEQP